MLVQSEHNFVRDLKELCLCHQTGTARARQLAEQVAFLMIIWRVQETIEALLVLDYNRNLNLVEMLLHCSLFLDVRAKNRYDAT
jgi:hypothetical protein